MSDFKRQRKPKEYKPAWQRIRHHPSNNTVSRLGRLPSQEETEPEPDLQQQLSNMASKIGKQPMTPEEFKRLLAENNTLLFARMDKLTTETTKIVNELKETITKNDKDIKVLKLEMNSMGKQMQQMEEKLEVELDYHMKALIRVEDQIRRSNMRLKFFKEQAGEDLRKELMEWFKVLAPDVVLRDEDIDRVHRVGARRRGDSPRDILVKFASYYKKEKLMKKFRSMVLIKFQDAPVQIYNDLCQQTVSWRRSVKLITQKLTKKGIRYSWGYPVFLRFFYDGKQHRVTSVEQGMELLEKLGLAENGALDQATGGEEEAGASGI